MSLRGVKQLKELVIRYSDYDGSSRGLRQWMGSNLLSFAKQNPELAIKTELVRCKHPILRGAYLNGNNKTICVKNLEPAQIEEQLLHLRNQIGKRMNSTGYKKPVVSMGGSVQGEWHERMDLVNLPVTIVRK